MKNLKKILFILFIIVNLISCSMFKDDSDSIDETTSSRSTSALIDKITSSIPMVQKSFLTDQVTSSNITSQNIMFAVSGETGYETQRYRFQCKAWDGGIAKAFGEEGSLYSALETAGIYYSIRNEFVEKGNADNLLIEGKTLAQWGVTATFETINESKELKFASPNNSIPSSLIFTTKVTIFWTYTYDGKTETGYDYAYFTKNNGNNVLYLTCSDDECTWTLYIEENSDGTYKIAEYDTYTGRSYNGSYEYDSNGDSTNDTKITWSTSGSKDISASYAEKTNTNGDFKFYYYSDYSYTDITTVTVNGVKDDNRSYNEKRGYKMSTYLYGNVEKDGKFMVRTSNNSNWRNSDEWYLTTYNASTKELSASPLEMDFSHTEGTRAVKNLRKVTETDEDGETYTYCDYDTDFFPNKKGSAINGVYGYLSNTVSTSDGSYSISKSDMWSSADMPQ